ncbi:hypothetical protein ES703_28837 [subsurface metagenome]
MLDWIKKNLSILITVLVVISFSVFIYSCEPKVPSLIDGVRLINRQELQLELDQFITLAQMRMLDLDRQDELRAVILQNALILVQGNPLNPVGIITGVAAIYGLTQAGGKVTKTVKTAHHKRKVNNGTA